MSAFAVIFPAAGKSSRFRDKEKKPFANLDGRAVWLRSVELFINRSEVKQCIVVVSLDDQEMFRRRFGANLMFMNVQIANGGAERFESVANALAMLKPEIDFVAVHDAVRPCLTEALVSDVFAKAEKTGAAMLGVPISDTIKQVDANKEVKGTTPRQGLWLAQTPQVFRRDWLEAAYADRAKLGSSITDDAQLLEAAGRTVHIVEGASTNIKITTRQDLFLADAILKSLPKPKPSGPAHPFAEEEMWGGKGLK
ncbi:MAG: 2-C-methyl-D-erythritol 4-phosphate cytidylyltransferase [Planctomycetes bacterium]|nr:2-C-methyl-D-erythritol 4-phosphate cytidylyltransferase [Planctomycetota bacterium]